MRLKLTLLFLLAFFNVAMSQIFPEKQPTVYAAEVFKQDQSKSAFGILWAAEEDKLMILPKKQYRKWKKSKLESPELTFTEINPDNLLYLKVFNAKKPRYAVSYGIFAGLGIGMITGFIRKGQYEKDFCEQAEDPLWIRCIPEDSKGQK